MFPVQQIHENGGRNPLGTALTDGKSALTHEELSVWVKNLSASFRKAGTEGRIVAVAGSTGIHEVVATMAVMDAGGIPLLVDAHAESPVLEGMLSDRTISAICCAKGFADRHHAAEFLQRLPILRLWDEGDLSTDALPDPSPLPASAPARLPPGCAILPTSGTTGAIPKAAAIGEENLRQNARQLVDLLNLREKDVGMSFSPIFTTLGLHNLCAHLSVGATLLLWNELFIPNDILRTMKTRRITEISVVPAHLHLLLERGDTDWNALSSLHSIRIGAGGTHPSLLAAIFEKRPDLRIVKTYGMTEIGLITALDPSIIRQKPNAVGKPPVGVSIRLLDDKGEDCPSGIEGEIAVVCNHAFLGYLPALEKPGSPFRTGDVGTIDREGELIITGRRKELIKIAGANVWPEEIENVIRLHPAVADVCVVGVDDRQLGEVPVALVVPRPTVEVKPSELLEHCHSRLPPVKIPRKIVFVEQLPRSALGKVNRNQLRRNLSLTEENS